MGTISPMTRQKDIFDNPDLDSPPVPGKFATGRLYADVDNPRTEVLETELAELADDIHHHGILQLIVVHHADAEGRYRIHFSEKRWRAAQRLGLRSVPVVIRNEPTNPHMQVSEVQKRHGLTPLDLARFIRGRVNAGETNTAVARQLGMDLTTMAHHLALLDLPLVLDEARKTGRCSSPRTLSEMRKLHENQPERVPELVAGTAPITREVVAAIRKGTSTSHALARAQPAMGARALFR